MTGRSPGRADGETRRSTAHPRRALPAGFAVGILTVGLGVVAGPNGLAIAAVTAIAWGLAPAPYAIAAGHVALATLAPAGLDPLAIGIVEAGFVAILAAALLRAPAAREALAAATLALVVTAAAALLAIGRVPVWGVAAVVLLVPGAVGYATFRYQHAAFGLVADGTGSGGAGGSAGATDDRERTGRGTDATTTSTSTTSDS